jgi:hypothetical protein
MVSISKNGIITINAGDKFETAVFINGGSELEPVRYILKNDDKLLWVIVEPNKPFECGVVRKILTKDDLNDNNDPVLKLKSSDTLNLLPGTYYYEARLVIPNTSTGEEDISTVIPRRKFIIL